VEQDAPVHGLTAQSAAAPSPFPPIADFAFLSGYFRLGPFGINHPTARAYAFAVEHPETAAAYVQLNQVIAADAAAAGATVADSVTPFNLAPDEPATLCAISRTPIPRAVQGPATGRNIGKSAHQRWIRAVVSAAERVRGNATD
jgi:hypothetical protein